MASSWWWAAWGTAAPCCVGRARLLNWLSTTPLRGRTRRRGSEMRRGPHYSIFICGHNLIHVLLSLHTCSRIKKTGGFITWNSLGQPNVNGRLAMTRSIGDFDLKKMGVIAEPETKRITVSLHNSKQHFRQFHSMDCCLLQLHHVHDSFLALTTDGINFIMNSQEICNVINQCHDPKEAAQRISDQVRWSKQSRNGSWKQNGSANVFHFSASLSGSSLRLRGQQHHYRGAVWRLGKAREFWFQFLLQQRFRVQWTLGLVSRLGIKWSSAIQSELCPWGTVLGPTVRTFVRV